MIESAVLLVDNRGRDLDVASLLAFQLRKRGIECYLEPLEAFRAAVAHKPGIIVFNHLFASHLAKWSNRLNDLGVLTAVLTNEGLANEAELRYQSGAKHSYGHIDLFFCWNERHKHIMLDVGAYPEAKSEVVGVPRFDFYFKPWSRIIESKNSRQRNKQRVLFCTNTGFAQFRGAPKDSVQRQFAQWSSNIDGYNDIWQIIELDWHARERLLEFAGALASNQKFEVILRPHPLENPSFYLDWASRNPRVRVDSTTNISGLIMDADMVISAIECTTGLEGWIAKKPVIGLSVGPETDRSSGHVICSDPSIISELAENELADSQDYLRETREAILQDWCGFSDGRASDRIADKIATALFEKSPADWSKLDLSDHRRAARLRIMRAIGEAYHYSPLLNLKHKFSPEKYRVKLTAYRKTIKPNDVLRAMKRYSFIDASPGGGE